MVQAYVYMYIACCPKATLILNILEESCRLAGVCGRHEAATLLYLLILWENDERRANFHFPKFQLRGCHGCRVVTRNVKTYNPLHKNLAIFIP